MTQSSPHTFLQPEGWVPAKGYANGVMAEGRIIVTGGLVGWNAQQEWVHTDMLGQFRQMLENIVAVLAEADARPEHIVRLTWYITDKAEYLARQGELGAVYREVIGRHFPAMTMVEVSALVEDRAQVEIEVTAVLPDDVRDG